MYFKMNGLLSSFQSEIQYLIAMKRETSCSLSETEVVIIKSESKKRKMAKCKTLRKKKLDETCSFNKQCFQNVLEKPKKHNNNDV